MSTTVIDIDRLLDIDPFNGKVVIRGSRLRVGTLIGLHINGHPPEEIAGAYPNLSLSAVYAALSYYYGHQQEMDDEDAREEAESLAFAKSIGAEIL